MNALRTIIFVGACAFFISCNQTPPRGGDPVRRDSIGDPLHPMDTTVDRLDPDSVTDTTVLEF